MIDSEKLSTLSLAILGLIAQAPSSGYDVRKVFATTPMGSFSSSPGAIYPALKRLEKNGWIEGEVEPGGGLRAKQIFSATEAGWKVLRNRLSLPIGRKDMVWNLDDLILRFAFMEMALGHDGMQSFLTQYEQAAAAYVAELKQILEDMKPQMNTSSRLALEHGIRQYQMNAEWAAYGLSELKT